MYFNTTGNLIGDSGAESISRALQSNTSLKSLNISGVCCIIYMFDTTGNHVGYSGAESISRALPSLHIGGFSAVCAFLTDLAGLTFLAYSQLVV